MIFRTRFGGGSYSTGSRKIVFLIQLLKNSNDFSHRSEISRYTIREK